MVRGKKIYILILILITFLVSTFYFSYAFFTSKNEKHGKLNIVAGELKYKIYNTNLENNQIIVEPNDSITTIIEVTSLNEIVSKYELYYIVVDNVSGVEVGYTSDTSDSSKGIIKANEVKRIKVVITNNSSNKTKIIFGVHGGLSNLAYDDVSSIGKSLEEIKTGDTLLAWTYIGTGTQPNHFPNKGEGYYVESVSCDGANGIWNNSTWSISYSNITSNKISCTAVISNTEKVSIFGYLYEPLDAIPTLTDNFANTTDVSGLYKSTDTNSGRSTYYFRGAVENNYVSFADFTWRIVRVNEDGTIRLIMQNGINNDTKYKFTSTFTWPYMYYSNGNIKNYLATWYNTNLTPYDNYIVDGDYFCEQAKVKPSSNVYSVSATMSVYSDYTPDFKCATDGNGYGIVSSKIGTITYDELVFAGAYYTKYLSTYYLANGQMFFTMSPGGHNTMPWLWWINTNGGFYYYYTGSDTNLPATIRPVINLKSNINATGTGTITDPYVVQ